MEPHFKDDKKKPNDRKDERDKKEQGVSRNFENVALVCIKFLKGFILTLL